MNNTLIFTLRENLNQLMNDGHMSEKFIVLFGMNTPGDEVINYLAQRQIKVQGVVDNNPLNRGKKLAGVRVYSPEELLGEYCDNAMILICSRYFSEMAEQLQAMGYEMKRHIYKVLEMNAGAQITTEEEVFREKTEQLAQAYEYYCTFKKAYEGKQIYVAPVKANGDVYLISAMWKTCLPQDGDSAVLAVVGNACRKIAEMFHIAHVAVISQEEMEMLVLISRFLGSEVSTIKIIQPYYMYTNILSCLEGYQGLTFRDMFERGCFGSAKSEKTALPYAGKEQKEIEKMAAESGLVKGRSIILAPYANSLPQIAWELWEEIAQGLRGKGYKVFTNSASDSEVPVPGTDGIFFPIEDTVQILDYAGGFVAMRNGMCEVASSSRCRQVIIYPDKAGRFGKIKDIYGITNMGLGSHMVELEENEKIVEQVLEVF